MLLDFFASSALLARFSFGNDFFRLKVVFLLEFLFRCWLNFGQSRLHVVDFFGLNRVVRHDYYNLLSILLLSVLGLVVVELAFENLFFLDGFGVFLLYVDILLGELLEHLDFVCRYFLGHREFLLIVVLKHVFLCDHLNLPMIAVFFVAVVLHTPVISGHTAIVVKDLTLHRLK